eukprot:CAMPEP_0201522714 /NCGR_PEP_ID=MMETSP0161_2-20130828/18508_1 /ASSEMBLY_ACC=CAM_ASM_000251 /TAXON_ID=180227 /ORGANISM="Neoparamoeba aestuarina, Strain SoJaBio B1-5/56/2" /LENGTH=206 /DNA_ID=CAMNT_0047921635 /DNA_START=75 /DNA_END=695 /DNA_ORIENTATION=-
MAALPRIPCQPLGIVWGDNNGSAKVVLECFIDFCCPFSKKIFDRLQEVGAKYGANLKIVYQLVPQPWHPQSCIMAEGMIAGSLADPSRTNDMAQALFNESAQFYDVNIINKSRAEMYKDLGEIAASAGIDKEKFAQKLELDTSNGQKNGGNGATRVLKLYVKQHRQLGVHVTPTIRVNGLLCDSSSSWTLEQWSEFLDPLFANEGI